MTARRRLEGVVEAKSGFRPQPAPRMGFGSLVEGRNIIWGGGFLSGAAFCLLLVFVVMFR